MDLVSVFNLVFSLAIFGLGIKKYRDTGAKAFMFIAFAFLCYGVSHLALIMGMGAELKTVLIAVRSLGYILVIAGLLL